MGDGQIFLKTRRDVSFKKGLSNEPTFGLIHLAGQYLYRAHALNLKKPFRALKVLSSEMDPTEIRLI